MNPRRQFFKQFIGQIGVIRDDINGVEKIPLNRLHELPDDIVDEIVPVFFPDEEWDLDGDSIVIQNEKNNQEKRIELIPGEKLALELFEQSIKIADVSKQVEKTFDIPFDKARDLCVSLFFRLASHRICHPHKVYNINELSVKSEK